MASVTKRKWTHKGVEKEAWQVRYKDATGAYRGRQFDRKKDADRYRTKVESEIEGGVHIVRSQSQTLADAVKHFLEEVDNKVATGALRPTTARNYHSAFRQAILPALGHRVMLEIEAFHIEEWYHGVVRSKRMEAATAYRRIWFMKALFDFSARRKWVRKGQNPAHEAMEAIGRPKDNRIETFNIDEARKIIAVANERPYNARRRPHEVTRLAVNLAAFCGLRWGEIYGLTLGSIDLEHSELRIRHSLDGLGNLQEPKTEAGKRVVPLPAHIAGMLAEFIATYPTTNPEGIVLSSEAGTPQRSSNFWKHAWTPLQKRAGVATAKGGTLHFHALRHFACSWMIENGWPITDVSKMLGHANVSITLQVYAHALKGRSQSAEAMQSLAEKLLSQCAVKAPIALLNDTRETRNIINAEFSEVCSL